MENSIQQSKNSWDTPTSADGEIGYALETEEENLVFEPRCNFDFSIIEQFSNSQGGGLVISLTPSYNRNKTFKLTVLTADYSSPTRFAKALNRGIRMGGLFCNLNSSQLAALFVYRLKEYWQEKGIVKRTIERIGQQEDGVWVFSDRQYDSQGEPTDSDRSLWSFCDTSSSSGDYIPCPKQAEVNPEALVKLIQASRLFFGDDGNFIQALLTMGLVTGALNLQDKVRQTGDESYPIGNLYGEPGSGKTIAAGVAAALIGQNWDEEGIVSEISPSQLYEMGSRLGSLCLFWDDPPKDRSIDELIKRWWNRKRRMVRGNVQAPTSALVMITNHLIGVSQPATYSRMCRIRFQRMSKSTNEGFQALTSAMKEASGAFPWLIAFGWHHEEIYQIEAKLKPHLESAHYRVSRSLAIATHYAQVLLEYEGGDEDVLDWVIQKLCPLENNREYSGDYLQDFFSKVRSLGDEIGEWNWREISKRNNSEKDCICCVFDEIWQKVEQRFHPATYGKRQVLAALAEQSQQYLKDESFDLSDRQWFYRSRQDMAKAKEGESLVNSPHGRSIHCVSFPASLFR